MLLLLLLSMLHTSANGVSVCYDSSTSVTVVIVVVVVVVVVSVVVTQCCCCRCCPGYTHLLMESVCVTTHRHLSL